MENRIKCSINGNSKIMLVIENINNNLISNKTNNLNLLNNRNYIRQTKEISSNNGRIHYHANVHNQQGEIAKDHLHL